MKLSTIQAIVASLNERDQSPIADHILAAWAHDSGSAAYFRASATIIFTFDQAGEP